MCQEIKRRDSKLHTIGTCSDSGVHSYIDHLRSIIKIVQYHYYDLNTCLHLITDSRDKETNIATKFIDVINENIRNSKNIKISALSGRYYT